MIDTNVLRKKIIDLAIAGKLTDHTSGNASEELDKIIKTLNNSEQRYISDDEKWISIPSNWTWGRLVDLTTNSSLNDGDWVLSKDMVSEGPVKLIQLGSIGDCEYRYKGFKYLTEEHFNELNGKQIYPGYLLINRLVVNKMLSCIIPKMNGILMTAVDVCWVAPNDELYNLEYLMYVLSSTGVQQKVKELGHGVTRFRISKLNLIDIAFPLPPINEQQQIVDIVNELFIILKRIDDLQLSYVADYESLKNKAIEAGVYGKLTKQLSEDGSADSLFEDIQKEKESLIKTKKLKKAKGLPTVEEGEEPFEIPDNWKWVRIGEVFTLQSGKNITAAAIKNEADDDYRYLCYGGNGVRGYVSKSNVSGRHALIGRQGALCGNINMADGDFYATEHAVVVYQYANTDPDWAGYVLKALNLNQYATSVAQPGLAVGKIEKVLIPLPPVEEQKRIAKTIEDVLAAIDMAG
ncbi:MAG: restriction endonuclease subunit S [Lachnospiraceae bacterium]|nr:restriction endonuclease subunit S [Roseburia sp.]MCR5324346.1 restriction endonuclease subunit S [Lachnospiraceae bacterium]